MGRGSSKVGQGWRTTYRVDPRAALQPDGVADLNDVVKNPIPFVGIGKDMEIGTLLEDGTIQDEYKGSYQIDIDKVQTLQSFVLRAGIENYRSWDGSEKPYVCLFEGKYYLIDGNHRMAKAKLDGKKTMDVILSVRERR